MCWKYKNPHGIVFIKCDIANNESSYRTYLRCSDKVGRYDDYNYCYYCGKKLETKIYIGQRFVTRGEWNNDKTEILRGKKNERRL